MELPIALGVPKPPEYDDSVGFHFNMRAWLKFDISHEQVKELFEPILFALRIPLAHLRFRRFRSGPYSNLYIIEDVRPGHIKKYMLRVNKPVFPWFKTESEVATLTFFYCSLNFPVPRVLVYNNTPDNPLGAEWILMEYLPGVPYEMAKDSMTVGQKMELSRTIAHQWMDIVGIKCPMPGSFYLRRPDSDYGQILSRRHFNNSDVRMGLTVPRNMVIDAGRILAAGIDQSVPPYGEYGYGWTLRPYITEDRILVDQNANGSWRLTGIVGWSRVSTALPQEMTPPDYMPYIDPDVTPETPEELEAELIYHAYNKVVADRKAKL